MERPSRKPLPGDVAFLLASAGVLLCLVGATLPAEAWDSALSAKPAGHRLIQVR